MALFARQRSFAAQTSTLFAYNVFWAGVEHTLRSLPGVVHTECGYIGGHGPEPTYQTVCSAQNGWAEAVRLCIDTDILSVERAVEAMVALHNPTALAPLGAAAPEVGQYRRFFHLFVFLRESELRPIEAPRPCGARWRGLCTSRQRADTRQTCPYQRLCGTQRWSSYM